MAGDEARFQQVGLHRDVMRGFGHTLVHRARAVSDLQADIPEPPDQLGYFLPDIVVNLVRQQKQDVDIGVGEELRAPVAADGKQGELRRHRRLAPD